MDGFKLNKGAFGESPTLYTPATDRERAIGRLHEMAGDPSKPATCIEQEEARQYLKEIIRSDPELRKRLKYWKQFVDAPNGKERLYKEIVLPKLFEQMRFRRMGALNHDYFANYTWGKHATSTQESLSPWFRGYYYHWSDSEQWYNTFSERWAPKIFGLGLLLLWTRGWYIRHFGTNQCFDMIKNAKNSRRYYGRSIPRVPNPAMFVRNQMVLQAITRKMIRDGKAHNIHVQQAINSLK